MPGLVAIAYQHETSRCGDPHLHTHVIVPNRQARADGVLVSLDGTSLYHEARAAGMIYQATLRRELHQSMGFEWAPVDESTGMAELAGVDRDTITAWSRRSSQLREWAAHHLTLVEGDRLSAARLAAAQKATRPAKPEELVGVNCCSSGARTRAGCGWTAQASRRRARRGARPRAPRSTAGASPMRRRASSKAAFTRADLVEIIGAQLPVDSDRPPREVVEAAVDELGMRLTAPRAAHQREGHERFTLDRILAEEMTVLDLADARDDRAQSWVRDGRHRRLSRGSGARGARTLRAHPGWCSRCPRRRVRARPPRCARCRRGRTTATGTVCWCWRRPARPSTSPYAKAPATPASPSPKPSNPSKTAAGR